MCKGKCNKHAQKENVQESLNMAEKELKELEKEIEKQGGTIIGWQDEQKIALVEEIKQWKNYLKNKVYWV